MAGKVFTLEVELGNAEMGGLYELRHALERSFDRLANRKGTAASMTSLEAGDEGTVMDVNGNTVGHWRVEA